MEYSFGNWIKNRRKALDMTQHELAKRVGCSDSLIFKIEADERRPSRQIAELLAEHLEIRSDQRELFLKVARQERAIDGLDSLSPRVAYSLHPNLPLPLSPIIGREPELSIIIQQLQDPACRLLTLTGLGGVGKTRLALEVAHRLRDTVQYGACFVSLVGTSSSELIVPTIAGELGFSFSGAVDLKRQLFSFLKEKHILLVLDNMEHLLDGVELLDELLKQAPNAKLLTTSREPLNLRAEWAFEVQGLPVPSSTELQDVESNSAAALFIQRAKQVNAKFVPAPEDLPAITRICQLVEGLPLGVELAATWVRTLSCDEIAKELEHGMDFLSISARDVPTRHRSMHAAFDHSWKLLTEEEQGVLMQLSAFRGGFRREAADLVADATLTVLSGLVTKSLVRRSGAGRYDLHELIRQFAAEQLAKRPDVQATTQTRHGRYYLTSFGQADGRFRSAAQRETLAELTAEMDNFRAAWAWAVTHGEFILIEQTLRMFFRLYDTRGWFQEGVQLLDRALNALEMAHGHSPPERADQVALGHLLATRSWFAYRLADLKQAERMLERSLEILRPLNEPRVLVESLTYLGIVMEVTGNYARAVELLSEGLEIATAIGDRWFATLCLTLHTAVIGLTLGTLKPELTHKRLQTAVADWRLIGDPNLLANGLNFLSRSALRLGRYDEARAALEENVALNSSISFSWGLGAAYRELGIVAQAQGMHQQAMVMFRKSLATFTELGGSWFMARVLAEMGESILALGDEPEAVRVCREALRIATDIHAMPVALEALAGFARLQAKQGHREQALELLLMVLNHPASFRETKNRASDLRAELEAQLSSTQIEAIQAHAAEKAFETVMEDLLK